MMYLVITLVSHIGGLRLDSVFRHHKLKAQNDFHNALSSMFDEYGDV